MTLQSIAEVLCEQLTLDIKVDTVNVQRTAQAMRRRFRPYRPDEAVMMLRVPKSILPGDHQAFFVIELVNKHLDLSEILFSYNTGETRGRPPYDPVMMLTLLVYNLAENANLVSLKHVATDGSKFKANASKHKAMSYDRMCQTIEKYEKEIPESKAQIEMADKGNILVHQGQLLELHKDLKIREERLPVIKAAKTALEKRMKREAAKRKKKDEKKRRRAVQQKQPVKAREGKKSKKERTPEEKAQRNFTDPDSRIMPWKKTFEQCYNAQVAVDSQAQIIVGNYVNQATNDKKELLPMVCQIGRRFDRLPDNMSADSGFFSEENLTSKVWDKLGITSLNIPAAREEKGKKPPATVGRMPKDMTEAEKMVRKLRTRAGSAIYRARKSIVEPVFGQIKRCLSFDEFRLRGLKRVNQEFSFVCAIHNFKKLYTYGGQLTAGTG